jgi:CTP synthase
MNRCKVDLQFIHSEDIEKGDINELLGSLNGILVAPGFGDRGIEGKILAAQYARENHIPYFGVCLGMQCAVIEFARNVLGLKEAHSTEIVRNTPYPVIDLMEDQKGITNKGGTMRLGAYPCNIKKGSLAWEAYGKVKVSERHRHRFEFNNQFLKAFEKAGMIATGINPDTNLVEIMEIPSHPWFVGVQFHPEYRSTVKEPHPLFVAFVKAALEYKEKTGLENQ